MALQENATSYCVFKLALVNEICSSGVSRCELLFEEFKDGQCLETGVSGFDEREVVAMFVCLRDCGPVVPLFFNSFGFEQVVASVEFVVMLLGQ
ncbi:hypothetical protein F511_39358 [Dorcoceras hygrometricum]|uniref:Uncharacterized protein n=1 Tax=Dorcoceras hygrometricum TaxID=472368 RepID=A0A2Z7BSP0_9LAMI|nr:hypothetical protein F511_39358 [Dorcoceras hygrometricum]